MGHEDYKEMLSAHALAALDREAEHALNQHLSDCAACREELDTLYETAAALALAADPIEPSPQVREQILKRIKTIAQETRPDESSTYGESHKLSGNSFQTVSESYPASVDRSELSRQFSYLPLCSSLFVLWQQNRALQERVARSINQSRGSGRAREVAWISSRPPALKMLELAGY